MNPLLIVQAIDAALALFARATAYMDLVRKARSEGRDITPEELDTLRADDDAARVQESAAIAAAKARG